MVKLPRSTTPLSGLWRIAPRSMINAVPTSIELGDQSVLAMKTGILYNEVTIRMKYYAVVLSFLDSLSGYLSSVAAGARQLPRPCLCVYLRARPTRDNTVEILIDGILPLATLIVPKNPRPNSLIRTDRTWSRSRAWRILPLHQGDFPPSVRKRSCRKADI